MAAPGEDVGWERPNGLVLCSFCVTGSDLRSKKWSRGLWTSNQIMYRFAVVGFDHRIGLASGPIGCLASGLIGSDDRTGCSDLISSRQFTPDHTLFL